MIGSASAHTRTPAINTDRVTGDAGRVRGDKKGDKARHLVGRGAAPHRLVERMGHVDASLDERLILLVVESPALLQLGELLLLLVEQRVRARRLLLQRAQLLALLPVGI
mgnify:CR=1 FL=1